MKDKTKTVVVQMDGKQLRECAGPIIEVMNKLQFEKGFTIDQVLMAGLWAMGAAIKRRGGILLTDAILKKALPPLVEGYKAATLDKQRRDSLH